MCKLIDLQILKIKKIHNDIFNLGGGSKSFISLKNLTKICQNLTGEKIKISSNKRTSIYDIPIYITDNTKISKTYGWKPKKNIFEIVNDTYKWLKKNKLILKKYL